jgi:pimeloyl-ACP methyl ester carboxylesterase
MAVLDGLGLDKVHWVGESSGGIIGLLLASGHPERIASLTLCNTPTRIPDRIKQIYALDKATASDAMRAYGVGEWCRQTLGYRPDMDHASPELCDWVVREMDRTAPADAAAMHDCFEHVDTVPLLPQIAAPVLLLSGDKSAIASAQQQIFAETLPSGRVELVPGVGHGVNLLQPERCARLAAAFWQSLD